MGRQRGRQGHGHHQAAPDHGGRRDSPKGCARLSRRSDYRRNCHFQSRYYPQSHYHQSHYHPQSRRPPVPGPKVRRPDYSMPYLPPICFAKANPLLFNSAAGAYMTGACATIPETPAPLDGLGYRNRL